jgi:hypothetical protein
VPVSTFSPEEKKLKVRGEKEGVRISGMVFYECDSAIGCGEA